MCTLAREPAGHPHGSLITFGADGGEPIFLISDLAEHTRNLRADARASLLVAESRPGDPLANGRVTLLGRCAPVPVAELDSARAAYLERHPGAGGYANYGDFTFWRLAVAAVRYIGGYGRMSWIDIDAYRRADPGPIAPDVQLSATDEVHGGHCALLANDDVTCWSADIALGAVTSLPD